MKSTVLETVSSYTTNQLMDIIQSFREGKPDEVVMVMFVNFVGTPVQNITPQGRVVPSGS